MKKYIIVLKNDKEKTYRLLSLLLLAINFISILAITISTDFKKIGPLIFAIFAALSIFASYYFKPRNEKIIFNTGFGFFCIAWVTAGFWLIGIVNSLLGLLNIISTRKLVVNITETNILYPALFPRTIYWNEVSNMILKDNFLTIDLRNNKLIQQLIDDTEIAVNEREFNEFCQQQLNSIDHLPI